MAAIHPLAALRTMLALVLATHALTACSEDPAPDDERTPVATHPTARVVDPATAITSAFVPTLDPSTMVEAEVEAVVTGETRCEFRYTTAGRPIVAVGFGAQEKPNAGVVKLNGDLIALQAAPTVPPGANPADARSVDGQVVLNAGDITTAITPDTEEPWPVRDGVERREATLVFEIGDRLKVGYRGYYDCGTGLPAIRYQH